MPLNWPPKTWPSPWIFVWKSLDEAVARSVEKKTWGGFVFLCVFFLGGRAVGSNSLRSWEGTCLHVW